MYFDSLEELRQALIGGDERRDLSNLALRTVTLKDMAILNKLIEGGELSE